MDEQGYNQKEPLAFEIKKDRSVLVLTKTLKDGSVIQRRIGFDDQDPSVVQCRTELAHRGAEPKQYQLRVHPEFNTGCVTQDSRLVSAYVKDNGWTIFNEGWQAGEGPHRAQMEKAQGGACAIFNHRDGYGVSITYDPTQFQRLGFGWSDTYPQASLDLFSKPARLNPGESLAYSYSIGYLARAPK